MSRHAVIPPPSDRPRRMLRPDEAMALLIVVFLLHHLIGRPLLIGLGLTSVVPLSQWIFIAAPIIGFLLGRHLPLVRTLRLVTPRLRDWGATLCLALGVIGAAGLMMAAQAVLLGPFEWYQESMSNWAEKLTAPTATQLPWLLFTIAVTPAVCEELLFRGVLTRGLQPWVSPVRLCIIVGVLFGLFHGDPLQIVPAAVIGAIFTWLALASGSLWPCIVVHLLFNTATLLLRFFIEAPADATPRLWELALSAGLAGVFLPLGLWLLRPSRHLSNPQFTQTGVRS
jgi:membrane protease YdiL (CAAX protease family)